MVRRVERRAHPEAPGHLRLGAGGRRRAVADRGDRDRDHRRRRRERLALARGPRDRAHRGAEPARRATPGERHGRRRQRARASAIGGPRPQPGDLLASELGAGRPLRRPPGARRARRPLLRLGAGAGARALSGRALRGRARVAGGPRGRFRGRLREPRPPPRRRGPASADLLRGRLLPPGVRARRAHRPPARLRRLDQRLRRGGGGEGTGWRVPQGRLGPGGLLDRDRARHRSGGSPGGGAPLGRRPPRDRRRELLARALPAPLGRGEPKAPELGRHQPGPAPRGGRPAAAHGHLAAGGNAAPAGLGPARGHAPGRRRRRPLGAPGALPDRGEARQPVRRAGPLEGHPLARRPALPGRSALPAPQPHRRRRPDRTDRLHGGRPAVGRRAGGGDEPGARRLRCPGFRPAAPGRRPRWRSGAASRRGGRPGGPGERRPRLALRPRPGRELRGDRGDTPGRCPVATGEGGRRRRRAGRPRFSGRSLPPRRRWRHGLRRRAGRGPGALALRSRSPRARPARLGLAPGADAPIERRLEPGPPGRRRPPARLALLRSLLDPRRRHDR